ncbi:UDP-N-acetylmuramate dehydrogenase [Candidatus Cardinium hertigii]|uniref:UDP-N-acetylenolpyruvoylglucosamine reductase n=1 Tax=Candidatus Cardinium hertigii TaxID=247481 RepID=A0A3N2QBW4_9BACT|nr:UDP-N-acetylmuramate dehydrogenase [Candidatus Cardinium hertigii]ROT47306.1 UDP-N-acetylmuramate dehydrogenase [Candidatus Cardinium hertigii]
MPLFKHYSLQSINSFNVPALAAHYIPCTSLKDIEDFCATVYSTKKHFYILGEGTNTLFVGDFPGYILHIQLPGIEIIQETSHKVLIKAAAGVNWHKLVLFCVNRGYGGIENLSLISGTVGGAPVQNIGAYGVELKDVIHSIETIALATGKKIIFKPSECAFGYRTSIFKTKLRNQYIITGIVLALDKTAKFRLEYIDIQKKIEKMQLKQLSFKSISDAIIAIRQQKLPNPIMLGNAGSFFQNPLIPIEQYQLLKSQYPELVFFTTCNKKFIKISAAWLIETAGFKGFRQGNVGIYDLHALILVHYGGATGRDVINLANHIKQKVKNQFNITLIPEVNIVEP